MDESYIKAKVNDGFYSNATELVRDAVRRLREFDDNKYARLMTALDAGDRAIKEGHTESYTPHLLDQINRMCDMLLPRAESRIPMSAPEFRLELSEPARADFHDPFTSNLDPEFGLHDRPSAAQ